MMSAYDPLKQKLDAETSDKLALSFAEIEVILGRALPESAYKYQAWWSNEQTEDTRHVQCRSWLSAGFQVNADLARRTVEFRRMK